ncbi:hypothetical protein ES702_06605 [subsurface metagenome]
MDKTCFITGIDAELYKEFKLACVYYDLSIKAVLTKHMQNIVEDYRKDRAIYYKPEIDKHKKGKKR